jgi:hypothetical protein
MDSLLADLPCKGFDLALASLVQPDDRGPDAASLSIERDESLALICDSQRGDSQRIDLTGYRSQRV